MNALLKTATMLILVAVMLMPLGFYDSVSQAKSKMQQRLDSSLVENVARSEQRIKRNVEKLIALSSGLTLYRFQYKNDPTVYVGLMADELAKSKVFKAYVVHMGQGSYAIDYEKLGLHPVTLQTWEKEGLSAVQTTRNVAAKKAR